MRVPYGRLILSLLLALLLAPTTATAQAQSDDALPIFELDGLRVGLAICFEAAFAPIFSTLALQGAQLIFNPSAVPVGYAFPAGT